MGAYKLALENAPLHKKSATYGERVDGDCHVGVFFFFYTRRAEVKKAEMHSWDAPSQSLKRGVQSPQRISGTPGSDAKGKSRSRNLCK